MLYFCCRFCAFIASNRKYFIKSVMLMEECGNSNNSDAASLSSQPDPRPPSPLLHFQPLQSLLSLYRRLELHKHHSHLTFRFSYESSFFALLFAAKKILFILDLPSKMLSIQNFKHELSDSYAILRTRLFHCCSPVNRTTAYQAPDMCDCVWAGERECEEE